jgi:hypothetical protein
MVIACQYFMLVFAFEFTDDTLRASLGFNFSMLVLAHLIIGFIALITVKIIKLLPTLKKVYLKIKEYWPKIKEKLCKNRKRSKEQYKEAVDDIEKPKVTEEESKKEEPKTEEKKLIEDINVSFGSP